MPSMTKLRVLFMKRVFSSVNYNSVYGRRITTQYLRQIKENCKLNNSGFNKWLEILVRKDLETKLSKTEKVDLKFRASNGTAKANTSCQLKTEDVKSANTFIAVVHKQ